VNGAVRNVGGEVNGVRWIGPAQRRRRWSVGQKATIVAETLAAGAKVSQVAALHGVNEGLLYGWRRRAMARTSASDPGFVPVKIMERGTAPVSMTSSLSPAVLEVVLADATIRVTPAADATTLMMVLSAIRSAR
jgi:transposase